MKEEDRYLFQKAIDKWGEENQILKTIEEMAELTQAIMKAKFVHGQAKYAKGQELLNVVEELCDVKIMIEQLEYNLQPRVEIEGYTIDGVYDSTIERLKRKLQ